MRSILWQLKQYQRLKESIFIDADELLDGIKGNWIKPPWADVLYSIDFYLIFKSSVRGHKRVSHNFEMSSDGYLKSFINENFKDGRYIEKYKLAITPSVRLLILYRALVGTFQVDNGVHKDRRPEICRKLNVKSDISLREANSILEGLFNKSSIEDMILARIGYMIILKDLKDY